MKHAYLFLITLFTAVSFAQPPDTLWTQLYGQSNYVEVANAANGETVLGGSKLENGWNRFFTMRLNSDGDSLWCRWYSAPSSYPVYTLCNDFFLREDDSYLLVGYTQTTQCKGWLLCLASNGDSLWSRCYSYVELTCVLEARDGAIVLGGEVGEGSSRHWWLGKLTSTGQNVWEREYFWPVYTAEGPHALLEHGGGFIVVGRDEPADGNRSDLRVLAVTEAGTEIWRRSYGGTGSDEGYDILQESDSTFLVGGFTSSYGAGGADYWLIRINAVGDSLWSRTYGGPRGEGLSEIEPTFDGGYVLIGNTMTFGTWYSDFWLVRINAVGDSLWSRTFDSGRWEGRASIVQNSDSSYTVAGGSFWNGDPWRTFVIRTDPQHFMQGRMPVETPSALYLSQAYPNPFNTSTQITLKIASPVELILIVTDLLGRYVATLHDGIVEPGEHSFTFDGSDLPSGIYFAHLQSGEFVSTQKLLLLK